MLCMENIWIIVQNVFSRQIKRLHKQKCICTWITHWTFLCVDFHSWNFNALWNNSLFDETINDNFFKKILFWIYKNNYIITIFKKSKIWKIYQSIVGEIPIWIPLSIIVTSTISLLFQRYMNDVNIF